MNFKYNDGSNCGLAWRLWVTSHFYLHHRKEQAKAMKQQELSWFHLFMAAEAGEI